MASSKTGKVTLLAIDLGLRFGWAGYSTSGKLITYGSRHLGNRSVLRAAVPGFLGGFPALETLVIEGGHPLRGSVSVSGSKNATMGAMAAALLVAEDCVLENVPDIGDVTQMAAVLRSLGAVGDFGPMVRKAARWAQDSEAILRSAEPDMPASLFGRRADNWRHLIAIADAAGGRWPDRARQAAETLSAQSSEQTAGSLLLEDIRAIFADIGEDRITSAQLVPSSGSSDANYTVNGLP